MFLINFFLYYQNSYTYYWLHAFKYVSWGKLKTSVWFLLGQDFAKRTIIAPYGQK